jgi:hypothetical protein
MYKAMESIEHRMWDGRSPFTHFIRGVTFFAYLIVSVAALSLSLLGLTLAQLLQ